MTENAGPGITIGSDAGQCRVVGNQIVDSPTDNLSSRHRFSDEYVPLTAMESRVVRYIGYGVVIVALLVVWWCV